MRHVAISPTDAFLLPFAYNVIYFVPYQNVATLYSLYCSCSVQRRPTSFLNSNIPGGHDMSLSLEAKPDLNGATLAIMVRTCMLRDRHTPSHSTGIRVGSGKQKGPCLSYSRSSVVGRMNCSRVMSQGRKRYFGDECSIRNVAEVC
jgi:hypothetical protein